MQAPAARFAAQAQRVRSARAEPTARSTYAIAPENSTMKPCSMTTMSRLKPGISKLTSAPPWNSAPNSRLASTMPSGWLRPIIATAMPVKPAPPTKSSSSLPLHAGDLVHADQPGQRARDAPSPPSSGRLASMPAYAAAPSLDADGAQPVAGAALPQQRVDADAAASSASSRLRFSGDDGHADADPGQRLVHAGQVRAPGRTARSPPTCRPAPSAWLTSR